MFFFKTYVENEASEVRETALYFSSNPLMISSTSLAFSRVMLVAREWCPKPVQEKLMSLLSDIITANKVKENKNI